MKKIEEKKVLINMQFDPELAKEVGVEEAIMHRNIEYWCAKNEANKKHYYEGSYWTYNTQKAFEELFSFWTRAQIRRILFNLEDKNKIKSGNFNKVKYDQTKWYAIVPPK